MKRRGFLKTLTAATAVITVAPTVLASTVDTAVVKTAIPSFIKQYPLTPAEAFGPQQVLKIYHKTGMLIYRLEDEIKALRHKEELERPFKYM